MHFKILRSNDEFLIRILLMRDVVQYNTFEKMVAMLCRPLYVCICHHVVDNRPESVIYEFCQILNTTRCWKGIQM